VLRFFVNEAEPMQQILDAGRCVCHTVSFGNVTPDRVAGEATTSASQAVRLSSENPPSQKNLITWMDTV
jgi:hypothetical protein